MTGGDVAGDLRQFLRTAQVDSLLIEDLQPSDLSRIGWSGSARHLRYVQEALARVASGDVQYLAVRAPGGEPVATGGIDYSKTPGAGELWQLATHPDLQSLGLGTHLILGAEQRIRQRGLHWAVVRVEDDNPRARALYERLGYEPHDRWRESWDRQDEQGNVTVHEGQGVILRKRL